MRIVIADDDMLVSGALRTILEKDQDIEVQGIASNGKEAIELYRKYEPDVLLMDIRMSPMSGLEASEEILKEKGIRLVAEDTGLNYGRTVELHCDTGEFLIKSVGKPIKTI